MGIASHAIPRHPCPSPLPRGKGSLNGAEGGRTLYLIHAMDALSQMSYGPGNTVVGPTLKTRRKAVSSRARPHVSIIGRLRFCVLLPIMNSTVGCRGLRGQPTFSARPVTLGTALSVRTLGLG